MISFMQTLRLALQALVRNRSRSMLTMLGVVIGVAAVIVTVAIGTGAKSSVANQINGLGSNLVMVIPGSVQTSGARTGNGGASTLTVQDGLAIAKLPGVSAVSPQVSVRTQLIANGNNWQTIDRPAPRRRSRSCARGRSRADASSRSRKPIRRQRSRYSVRRSCGSSTPVPIRSARRC